jgi:hypothetical protein
VVGVGSVDQVRRKATLETTIFETPQRFTYPFEAIEWLDLERLRDEQQAA